MFACDENRLIYLVDKEALSAAFGSIFPTYVSKRPDVRIDDEIEVHPYIVEVDKDIFNWREYEPGQKAASPADDESSGN